MENIVQLLSFSHADLEWNRVNKEIVDELEIPVAPSIFPSKDKCLCESGVDLICSITSRPCSG